MVTVEIGSKEIICMNPKDNVGVCLREIEAGEKLDVQIGGKNNPLTFVDSVPMGHKVALKNIQSEEIIIKYGEIIGKATNDIVVGQHVHEHNVADYD